MKPDTTDARAHAEAVAYGKLVAVREILDALAQDRPARHSLYEPPDWRGDYVRGYDRAVRLVKTMRLGVEK